MSHHTPDPEDATLVDRFAPVEQPRRRADLDKLDDPFAEYLTPAGTCRTCGGKYRHAPECGERR